MWEFNVYTPYFLYTFVISLSFGNHGFLENFFKERIASHQGVECMDLVMVANREWACEPMGGTWHDGNQKSG